MEPNENPTPSNVPASTPETTGFNPDEISAVNPEVATTEPVMPAEPKATEPVVTEPVAPVEPVVVAPTVEASNLNEPVVTTPANPAVLATPPISTTPVAPVAPVAPTTTAPETPAPTSPAFSPVNEGFSATEPITRPDPVPTMSPEEKELAAPITAAGPVPGSIGSAISMPSGAGPQSTTFNDPATEAGMVQNASMNATAVPAKAKSSKVMLFGKEVDKKLLIIAGALAGVLIIALIVILIMQLNG